VGAEADDTEAEYIRSVCEKRTVTGDNLVSISIKLVVFVTDGGGPK